MHIKIHKDCFNLDTENVRKLRSGSITPEDFAQAITDIDPFVLMDDTVYALSESEFLARRCLRKAYKSDSAIVELMLSQAPENLQEPYSAELAAIQLKMKSCSDCTKRAMATKLIAMYKETIGKTHTEPADQIETEVYPKQLAAVESTVTGLCGWFFRLSKIQREACLDCVYKHITHAHVLATEYQYGYYLHKYYMCAQLAEAVAELPDTAARLRDTLRFCITLTEYSGSPFLPIGAILGMLDSLKAGSNNGKETASYETTLAGDPVVVVSSARIREYVEKLDKASAAVVVSRLSTIQEKTRELLESPAATDADVKTADIAGNLAILSDSIMRKCPALALIYRTRRKILTLSPQDYLAYHFDDADLIAALQNAFDIPIAAV